MKAPDRFWSETADRLTDVALAALLAALLRRPAEYPVGVIHAWAVHFRDSRFAWAAEQIAGELAAAPGVTVDNKTGLAVIWSIAELGVPHSLSEALAVGRRVGATASSFTRELADRVQAPLSAALRDRVRAGVAEHIAYKGMRPQRPRPRVDPFEPLLAFAKKRERQLRAEFDGVDDRGEVPSAADRLAFVNALGAGYDPDDLLRALDGRAAKCRRSRLWQGTDTAESFLRIAWVFTEKRRIDDAIQAAPAAVEDTTIMRGPGGTFVAGRQVFDDKPDPAPSPPADGDDQLQQWVARNK